MNGETLLQSWEDLDTDDILEGFAPPPTAAPNATERSRQRGEEERMEQEFAQSSFLELIGHGSEEVSTKALIAENKELSKKLEALKKAKPKVTDGEALQLLDVSTTVKCEQVANVLAEKLKGTKLKSSSYYRFIDILLQVCRSKMDKTDLESLEKKFRTYVNSYNITKTTVQSAKRKPNTNWGAKHYQEEMDMLYGDEEDEDEEDGASESDDYYRETEEEDGMDGF